MKSPLNWIKAERVKKTVVDSISLDFNAISISIRQRPTGPISKLSWKLGESKRGQDTDKCQWGPDDSGEGTRRNQ
ncbi:hypothetical protein WG66_010349 [Moniliophthora roreri]|nr:hypothetical protein WG66_010349 [Moniliophthora roreri]